MPSIPWNDLSEQFAACERLCDAMPDDDHSEGEEGHRSVYECQLPIVASAVEHAASLEQEDIEWFDCALKEGDWSKSSFVAAIFYRAKLDRRLLPSMLEAAIGEDNPSSNRIFVEPCMNAWGARVVNEALLDRVESGNDFEKAGAVNALYWATVESRSASEDLDEVWNRKRCLFLKTFVENENVNVRRSVLSSLKLTEALYPSEYKPLVSKAIEIARNHPDEYIRSRLMVQLGGGGTLPSLPHRHAEDPNSDGSAA